jgi:hypothetical protein
MGDRTNFQLQVTACPPEQASAVLDWIAELGLGEDWPGSFGHVAPPVLKLAHWYVANEVSCGSTGETIAALAELPGVSFTCYEDPYADWLGEVAHHVHDLTPPTWRNDCDANGRAYFTADEVDKVLAMDGPAREWFLGRRHAQAVDRLCEEHEGVVLIPVDEDGDTPAHDYVCTECGTSEAHEYVVTILDPADVKNTRTEVCRPCHLALIREAAL